MAICTAVVAAVMGIGASHRRHRQSAAICTTIGVAVDVAIGVGVGATNGHRRRSVAICTAVRPVGVAVGVAIGVADLQVAAPSRPQATLQAHP